MSTRHPTRLLGLALVAHLVPLGCGVAVGSEPGLGDAGAGGASGGGGGGGGVSEPVDTEAEFLEKFAEITCDATRNCNCEGTYPACEQDVAQKLETPRALIKSLGHTWDAACAGQIIAQYAKTANTCSPEFADGCCRPYVGPVSKGQPCSFYTEGAYTVDDCGQGLRCSAPNSLGTCIEVCPAPSGREGDSCAEVPCAAGFSCINAYTCFKDAALGESCVERRCAEGSYCSVNATCQPQSALGGACESAEQCAAERHCVDGTCRDPKAAGERCSSDQECSSACWQGACAVDAAVCSYLSLP